MDNKVKVYQFWSRRKKGSDYRFNLTEMSAHNISDVRRWAQENDIEIEKNRIRLKK